MPQKTPVSTPAESDEFIQDFRSTFETILVCTWEISGIHSFAVSRMTKSSLYQQFRAVGFVGETDYTMNAVNM